MMSNKRVSGLAAALASLLFAVLASATGSVKPSLGALHNHGDFFRVATGDGYKLECVAGEEYVVTGTSFPNDNAASDLDLVAFATRGSTPLGFGDDQVGDDNIAGYRDPQFSFICPSNRKAEVYVQDYGAASNTGEYADTGGEYALVVTYNGNPVRIKQAVNDLPIPDASEVQAGLVSVMSASVADKGH